MNLPTITVRPAPGRRVRHPETGQPMGPEWGELPRNDFAIRRLRDGDLEERPDGQAPAEAPPPADDAEPVVARAPRARR